MAVFLGSSGTVQLNRTSDGRTLSTSIDPADVTPSVKRLSFDFQQHEFMTGDLLEFTRINPDGTNSTSDLDFVDPASMPGGAQSPQMQWYVNVDESKGMSLYRTWDDALENDNTKAASLLVPSSTYPIEVQLKNNLWHCLGEVASYELNNNRNTADVTSLGDSFAERISTLISGSGNLETFWSYEAFDCGDTPSTERETSHYLHQLILRQHLGATFQARLFMKVPSAKSMEGYGDETMVYYDVTGVISDIGISFSPDEPVRSLISFVTTGPIKLLSAKRRNLILNTTGGSIVQQNNQGNLLLQAP
jgi:hypothetical protein